MIFLASFTSLDLSLGIEVSKDVTALVKSWLQREDDQKIKLPTPPKIKHWPERLAISSAVHCSNNIRDIHNPFFIRQGLGAEILQETKIQQNRSAMHAKIKQKLMNAKRKRRSNFEELSQRSSLSSAIVQPVEHQDSSDDEECSKANTVLLSRKRSLTGISSIHSYSSKRKKTRTSLGVRTVAKSLNSAEHFNVVSVSSDDGDTLGKQILASSRQRECHVNNSLSQQKNTVRHNSIKMELQCYAI